MDEGVSGFEVRGTWREIVEHGRRITDALRDQLRSQDTPLGIDFQQWEDWRPKVGDSLDAEMARKTSQQASISRGKGEQAGKAPTQDLQSAGQELQGSVGELGDKRLDGAASRLRRSGRYLIRAADSAARKLVRRLERVVYERLMTRISPYYFDNDLVSANLRRDRNGGEETFVFEVNVNDDELKDRVSDRMQADEPFEEIEVRTQAPRAPSRDD